MTFELALRVSEVMLAFAFSLQSLEYWRVVKSARWIFLFRILLCSVVMSGVYSGVALIGLWGIAVYLLHRFQGPYNGGSDRMGILILTCQVLSNWLPDPFWQKAAFGYLGVQMILSYFISGWVKIVNSEWRSGQALSNVFEYSAYPVSENLRGWAKRPHTLLLMSWAVILFELIFPLSFLNQWALYAALFVAAAFHFSNACFFGLNRFFWVWISAYPSLIWLQLRVFG
ncbi:HTTM domain-containing protein [Sneathiella sp. P13V-1]|uniref:HTTM domain-containing protein n=1 Tax=Sneathiella sp. P13V-1 TaxID=2697366 RepID=UPI00187B9808|nr:HTTM domain-containing protein [Sneathiella sp. P13V-1]MBE7638348.1 HTTM domain-containing protein [Sneathiella sp. P13V-1]